MNRLLGGHESLKLALETNQWVSTETDRRTDGQTDKGRHSANLSVGEIYERQLIMNNR